jgi:(S)-ureidoglycine aminohydrolase
MKLMIISFLSLGIFLMKETSNQVKSVVYSWNALEVTKQETRESRPILEGSTTHLEFFKVHATTLYPGQMPHASHAHEADEELILLRQGQIKITTENTGKILGPGGIALILPGEEHGLENIGESEAIYYIMKFRSKEPMDIQRSVDAGGTILIDRSDLGFIARDKGGRWNYFDRPTTSCTDFEMHATRLNAGMNSHAPHTHVQEEIILMLEGEASMHIDGREFSTSVGDVIFLDANVPHAITNTSDMPCEYFAFQWK